MTVPSHPASRATRGYSGAGVAPSRALACEIEIDFPVGSFKSDSRSGPALLGSGRLTGGGITLADNDGGTRISSEESVGSSGGGPDSGPSAGEAVTGLNGEGTGFRAG